MWSNVLNDDATINIHIKIDNHNNLPENVLAGAVPFFETGTSYSTFRNHLSQDRLTSDDYTAVDSLETGSTWAIDTYGGGIANIPTISLTRANAKALNLINPHDSQLDGVITMRGNLPWQKIYNNPLASNKFDMTSVAMHEMGHILGFVGTLDSYNPFDTTTQLFSDMRSQFIEAATTLDLFRYGRDYSTNKRLIKFGGGNFSIDRGVTKVGELSYGTIINGDNGYQASHWRNVDNLGLMDPVAELGQRSDIGNLDLTALDVIGWDRVSGTKSVNTLYNEAKAVALPKIGVNRNIEVDQMLADWRWARRGSASRLRQAGDIAQFLAQEGFFSIGSFRSTFEFSSTASTKFLITVKEDFSGREFESNLDLGAAREIVSHEINSALLENTVEDNLGINYEELLALITEELSDAELNQLSLDDLAKLIEQHLAESVV